jgi:hypothetical protein
MLRKVILWSDCGEAERKIMNQEAGERPEIALTSEISGTGGFEPPTPSLRNMRSKKSSDQGLCMIEQLLCRVCDASEVRRGET